LENINSAVSEARIPNLSSFLPEVNPSVPFSTTKAGHSMGISFFTRANNNHRNISTDAVRDKVFGSV
jgi:hypothetical protein